MRKLYKPFIILILCYCFFLNYCYPSENLTEIGNKYFSEKKYDEAMKIYVEAMQQGYKTFDVFSNLAYIFQYEKNNLQEAKTILKKGISIYPNSDILHSALSQIYLEENNLSAALKEYRAAVNLGKDRTIVINVTKVREILKNSGKSEKEIMRVLKDLLDINPNDYLILYELAVHEQNNNQFKDALDKYFKIIKLSPNMRNVIIRNIGICFYNLGNYKSAELYLLEAKKNGDFVPEEILNNVIRTEDVL